MIRKFRLKIYVTALCFSLIITCFTQCGIYSFTGISLSPEVKTVNVDYFQNMAPLVVPSLSNTFTDALQQKFMRQTRLTMVGTGEGDIQLSGEIRGYDISPVAITGNDVASKNRLTIRVNVKFVNNIEPEQNFEKDFSAYEDFEGSQSVDQVQDSLIDIIVETLVENIFNASVTNW